MQLLSSYSALSSNYNSMILVDSRIIARLYSAHTVLMMVIDFIVLFVFSLAIGAATGFGLSYLLKVNESFNRSPIK